MRPIERAGLRAHSRTLGHRRRLGEAAAIVAAWLERCQHPIIAFSGGKDSTVLLWLVRAAAPDCPALWSDDEYSLPETLAYLDTIPRLHRIAATIMHTSWFVAWPDGAEGIPVGTEWVEARDNDGAGTWMRQHGYDGVAVGLRADENNYRRMYLRHYGPLAWTQKRDQWTANPLAWLTVDDIWAAIVANDLHYNAAYDRMAAAGIPRERQRVGPFANRRALPYGQLATLRMVWPAEFARFAARYPEAHQYA